MWFGTETGLAKFDGRRTQSINDRALPTPSASLRCKPTKTARCGSALTAARLRYNAGEFIKVNETSGQTITAIATDSVRLSVHDLGTGSRLRESRAHCYNYQHGPD